MRRCGVFFTADSVVARHLILSESDPSQLFCRRTRGRVSGERFLGITVSWDVIQSRALPNYCFLPKFLGESRNGVNALMAARCFGYHGLPAEMIFAEIW